MECDQNGTSLQVRKVAEEQGIDVDNAVNDLEERAKKVRKLLGFFGNPCDYQFRAICPKSLECY